MHLADAFIQRDLQYILAIHVFFVFFIRMYKLSQRDVRSYLQRMTAESEYELAVLNCII